MEDNIKWSDLLTKISKTEIKGQDEMAKKYVAWRELSNNDKEKLIQIGRLIPDNQSKETQLEAQENYWSEKYPISPNYYPYEGCKIFSHRDSQNLYFVYTEFGGHAPEIRCRLIQKHLIINS